MRELPAETAADALHKLGCSWVTSEELEESELVALAAADDVVLLADVRVDPILESAEAFVAGVVSPQPARGFEVAERSLPHVCGHFDVGRAVLALPFRWQSRSLRRVADYLHKAVGAPTVASIVRDATEDDWSFIRHRLRNSLVDGYLTGAPHVTADQIRPAVDRYVDAAFGVPEGTVVEAVVAIDDDGEAIGYAAWLPPERDFMTGRHCAALLDVEALPSHRGSGVRQLLMDAVEARLQGHVGYIRGQVVIEPDGSDTELVDALVQDGWMPVHSEFVIELEDQ